MNAARTRRLARVAAAAGLVLPWLGPVLAPASAGAAPVRMVRRWSPFIGVSNVKNSRLALDVPARVAYVFSQDVNNGGPLVVQPWHLDRFTPLAPPLEIAGFSPISSRTPIAVDERHHTVVVADANKGTGVPTVRVLALRGRELRQVAQVTTRFGNAYATLGLGVDAAHGLLLALGGPSAAETVTKAGAGVGGVQLDQWRLSDLAKGTLVSPLAVPAPVPQACGQIVTTNFAAAVMPSADGRRAYFGCLTNRGIVTPLGPNAGDFGGVAELDVAAAATGSPAALQLRTVPGNFATGESLVLPRQQRVVLVAKSTTVSGARVYDTRSRRFLGNVGIEDIGVYSLGTNPRTGQVYYVVSQGLGAFDAAATPATQGVVVEELSEVVGNLIRPMETDWKTSRVLIPTSDEFVQGDSPWVAVLRDDARPVAPDTFDPEANAVDAPERPGVTDSLRSADAAAVGVEYRMVGGPVNLAYNTTHFDNHPSVAKPGTRVQQFAATRGVRLTGTEASAEAIASRRDDATDAEAQGVGATVPLQCSDFGGTRAEQRGHGAAAVCDLATEQVHAEAVTTVPDVGVAATGQDVVVPVPVQVGGSAVSVTLKRAAKRGPLTAELTADATGVDLFGVVRIGRVSASLTSTAHGRPGTANVHYVRTVSDVVVNGQPLCGSACPVSEVQAAVNQALGGRAYVDFPTGDSYESKKGVAVRFSDDKYRHVERTLFDDVPNDSVLLPAMEVTVYQDGTSASRHIVTLASLSMQGLYRIYRLTRPGTPPPPPPTLVPTPLPTLPAVGPRDADGTTTTTTTARRGGGPTDPVIAAAPNDGIPGTIGRITRVVLRHPRELAGIAAVWALLAVPVYLSARRRLLLDLPRLRQHLEGA